MFMTDQDLDGSHIKGLCINLFHSEWASLLKLPGFLSFMNTPILRAKKGQQTLLFYNEGEYDLWRRDNPTQGWTIKYFKGLGTSTSNEFKEYFANKKVVDFVFQDGTDNTIDKIFNKKRADDRKLWLEQYNKTSYLDTNKKNVSYDEFVDQELIHFSTYDCQRSIPNAMDGLKTSLRKILYCAFKRRLSSEVKVAQFSGYVSEHSAYHHGEASLNGAIVNMAQTFVGSNNINLLEPNGQFGTRLQGGDDSASERYIFTQLNPLTRYLFPEADDPVLQYLNDDGTSIEPEYYVPVLPFVLINGQTGIGTGFSCSLPSYNPKDIMRVLQKRLLKGEAGAFSEVDDWVPYYEGFKGRVEKAGENKFLIRGCYEKVGEDSIRITELPVGTWTMPYIGFLEGLVDGGVDKNGKKVAPVLKDFVSVCTELVVDIVLHFPRGKLAEMGPEDMEKLLKLTTTVSTTNIHLFNGEFKLRKYNRVQDIMEDHYTVRMEAYAKRKAHLEKQMAASLTKIENRVKYILKTLDGTMDLRKKSADQVTALLSGYDKIDGDYKYLIKMPMDSVTNEHVENMKKELAQIEGELRELRATTPSQMWLGELALLEQAYEGYLVKRTKTVTKKEKVTRK
jgi:DNA topoisomerase-2